MNRLICVLALGFLVALPPLISAAPVNVVSIGLISDLTTNDWTAYPSLEVLGYNSANDGGGGLFDQQGTSCATDGGTIFKDSAGNCFVRRDRTAGLYPVDWFGAYGDGLQRSTGVANGTTTFTDIKASCMTALAAGQKHIVIVPPPGTAHAQVNTTFSCKSATIFLLAKGPSWSATDVIYYIGHDDARAFTNALSRANLTGTLQLSAPIYLVTSLSSGLGSIGGSVIGTGSPSPMIVLGGLESSSDGITFSASSQATYRNFTINCGFGGQDCVRWTNALSGVTLANLRVAYGQRDCLTLDGGRGSGIEHASADAVYIGHCGRHGLMVNQTNGAFFNAATLSAFNIRGVSQRQGGGACIYAAATGQSLLVLVQNLECDAQYGVNGQSTYRPLFNAVYFNSSSWVWDFEAVTVENTGGEAVCTGPCAAIAMNFDKGYLIANMRSVHGSSLWATSSQANGPVIASGILSLAAGGSGATATILRSAAYGGLSGQITIDNNSSSTGNSSLGVWQIVSIASTPVYSQINSTASYGSGASFTTTATVTGGLTSISVTNTSGSPTTLSYSMTGVYAIPSWNTQ
jgi:hypothetical protein